MQTGDADFAQDYAISAEVEDSIPPVLDVLKGADHFDLTGRWVTLSG